MMIPKTRPKRNHEYNGAYFRVAPSLRLPCENHKEIQYLDFFDA